jgi:hypothetical protein
MNGWEYRLFQKTSKWKFICVSGFVNAAKNNSIIVVLFLFNFRVIPEFKTVQSYSFTYTLIPMGYDFFLPLLPKQHLSL